MQTHEITIQSTGMRAKSVRFFTQVAEQYKSGIWIEQDGHRTNAKSVLGVMSAQLSGGSTITLLADGVDESEAIHALVELVSGF